MALLLAGYNNEIYNNILIQGDNSWIWGGGDGHDWDFRNNVIIDFVRQDLSPLRLVNKE